MHKLTLIFASMLALYSAQGFSNPTLSLPHNELVFEIVQDQFIFNHTNIEKASVLENNSGVYKGLHIKLKTAAAATFERVSGRGIRKRVNLVFNNKIISSAIIESPLKNDLLITGITKDDALQFVDELRRQR